MEHLRKDPYEKAQFDYAICDAEYARYIHVTLPSLQLSYLIAKEKALAAVLMAPHAESDTFHHAANEEVYKRLSELIRLVGKHLEYLD